ncbi:MAG: hypothetical protein IJC58_02830 [Oscillospiraceae bacterium]|nr:hypothetical protein [Oscillospiraceae bacterium]
MKKKLAAWEWIGFGVVCFLGTVLHFAYDWSGENAIIAVFSAVNESTWEHMKIFFMPYFLFSAAELFALVREYPNFLAAKALGVLTGLAAIPAVFYTARGIAGGTQDWFNISIFFFAAALSQLVSWGVMRKGKWDRPVWQIAGVVIFMSLAALFVLFTYAPPQIPLFADPVTGRYGR